MFLIHREAVANPCGYLELLTIVESNYVKRVRNVANSQGVSNSVVFFTNQICLPFIMDLKRVGGSHYRYEESLWLLAWRNIFFTSRPPAHNRYMRYESYLWAPPGLRSVTVSESIRVVLETPASRLTKPLPDSAEFTKRKSAAAAKALHGWQMTLLHTARLPRRGLHNFFISRLFSAPVLVQLRRTCS